MKMSIIQTLPNYQNWLYSHMNIYYDPSRGETFFGSSFNPEQPAYFSDIIDIEELEFYKIDPECIISFTKRQIEDGYYFVIMIKGSNEVFHELFIFGYDDELMIFNTILLTEHGEFDKNYISYNDLRVGFQEALNSFKYNPSSYYFNRSFCFLMSRIKPSSRYDTKNYAAEYFGKMCNEAYGTRVIFQCSDRDETYLTAQNYYTGISGVLILKELINNISRDSNNLELKRLRRSFFKLYEHRLMILSAMIWYEKEWRIWNNEIIGLRDRYSKCCDEMHKLCMLVLKLEQTSERSLIDRIVIKISEQYYNEKVILDRYVVIIREWYFNEVLNKNLNDTFGD